MIVSAERAFVWTDALQLAALALFLAVISLRTVRILVREGVNPIALSLRGKGAQGVAEVAQFACVNLWAVAVLGRALAVRMCPFTWLCAAPLLGGPAWRLSGIMLIVMSLALLLAGHAALGSAWRLGIDDRHPGTLVTRGIYRFSRNPLYLFFDLYFVGTFLLNGTAIFLAFAVITVANLHFQVQQEERFLLRLYGEAYRVYCRRTGRYITLPESLWAARPAPANE